MVVDQKYSYAKPYKATYAERKYIKSNHIRANFNHLLVVQSTGVLGTNIYHYKQGIIEK